MGKANFEPPYEWCQSGKALCTITDFTIKTSSFRDINTVGSEIQISLWVANGLDFEWGLKSRSPTI